MTIRTFSGTHDWHSVVLIDTDADEQGTADDIIQDIEAGRNGAVCSFHGVILKVLDLILIISDRMRL